MLNNISWATYWTALVILLLFYYLFVLVRYYRDDILRWATKPPTKRHFSSTDGPDAKSSLQSSPDETAANGWQGTVLITKSLLDEFLAFLEQAGEAQMQKAELLYGLNRIVKKYPFLPDSGDQRTISSLVIKEAKEKCSVHVSEEEMVHVWTEA